MSESIEEGQSVLCFGDVEVYAPRGTYQLVVRKMQTQGLGALQIAFQKLQAKLNAEGLFDASRKRPLPRFPRRIGIVTSPSGAAIRDFLEAASNRWKGVEIIIIPASVQGSGASRSIVAAIEAAHHVRPTLDALVITRGGGSLEDLWCFNEEPVVRAVAASKIPTVSGVGHEIDVTLCDLAADVRALTPTDAATKVLPDSALSRRAVQHFAHRLNQSVRLALDARRGQLASIESRVVLRRPHGMIHDRERLLDELDARGRRAVVASLGMARARIAASAASLNALSPLQVLARGFSVTMDMQGAAVTDSRQVKPGDAIRTRLHVGEILSTINENDFTPE
jgi:exodeoxyribonuclease VII large subunit